MLKYVLIGLAAIIVVFLIAAALQPADFRITRSATIAAPPAIVFGQFNDLHKMNEWSSFARLDPNAKTTFDGPPAGVGASLAWAGNNKAGEGRMTVAESHPSDLIRMKLEFIKPFTATNTAEFTFKPEGGQTAVTWSMSGRNNFMSKAMNLIINCDKMVGGEFEKSFANLSGILASTPKS